MEEQIANTSLFKTLALFMQEGVVDINQPLNFTPSKV